MWGAYLSLQLKLFSCAIASLVLHFYGEKTYFQTLQKKHQVQSVFTGGYKQPRRSWKIIKTHDYSEKVYSLRLLEIWKSKNSV